MVAAGWAVPIGWDGDPARLPEGYTGSLARAVADRRGGREPDALVVMAAQVHPQRRGQGLAADLLTAMRELAA
jgi:GNAT superfamily N-acetyltransferase